MNKYTQNQNGFALLLAIIVSGVVLSVGLAMLSVTLKQLDLGINTIGSERAFQAAAAGMDCVRYLRNSQPDEFTRNGQTVNIECFDLGGQSMTDILSANSGDEPYFQRFQTRFDWGSGQEARCMQFDVNVIDSVEADRSWNTINHGTISCDEGDICTFAYVQGYNMGCSSLPNNRSAVVRELSAEF
jgi:hypothetical protein